MFSMTRFRYIDYVAVSEILLSLLVPVLPRCLKCLRFLLLDKLSDENAERGMWASWQVPV